MPNSIQISKWISALVLVFCMLAMSLVRVEAIERDPGHVFAMDHEPFFLLARVDSKRR